MARWKVTRLRMLFGPVIAEVKSFFAVCAEYAALIEMRRLPSWPVVAAVQCWTDAGLNSESRIIH